MSTATAEAATTVDTDAPKPFTVTLLVRRYNPESERDAFWEDFDVEMYPTDRILDALR